jgi:glycosyltransferase involved in cell wall biosynthesis
MNSAAHIAVIIPAYNAERFVLDAVRSVQAQTRAAAEMFVIDDCSTDRTVELLGTSEFADVRVLRQAANRGPGTARNRAAALTRCEYLAFLDADDVWEPEHLETIAGLLDAWPEAGVAYGRLWQRPEEMASLGLAAGESMSVWPVDDVCVARPEFVFLDVMRGHRVGVLPSMMVVRRSRFVQLGGFSERRGRWLGRHLQVEDADFVLRAAAQTAFVASDRPTVFRRHHAGMSAVQSPCYSAALLLDRHRFLIKSCRVGELASLYERGRERFLRAWEEYLDLFWRDRRLDGLALMVWYSLRHIDLWPVTWRYWIRLAVAPVIRQRGRSE